MFPKSGHVLNLEESALFNEMGERFIALAEAGPRATPVRCRRLKCSRHSGVSRDERTRTDPGEENGPSIMPHWPLLQSIQALDGFELAVTLLWSIVFFAAIGFASDFIFNSKGLGPYWNAGTQPMRRLAAIWGSARMIGGSSRLRPMSPSSRST